MRSIMQKTFKFQRRLSSYFLPVIFVLNCGVPAFSANTDTRADKRLLQLAEEVRRDPSNVPKAMAYIDYANTSHYNDPTAFDWIGSVVKPKFAAESYQLAEKLGYCSAATKAAIQLAELSLKQPFTEKDLTLVNYPGGRSGPRFDNDLSWDEANDHLRRGTKDLLARKFLCTGQPAKAEAMAQKLANQAEMPGNPWLAGVMGAGRAAKSEAIGAKPVREAGMPHDFSLAGAIEKQTDRRVFENVIRQAESKESNSNNYWLNRAQYFSARGNRTEAVAAFEKSLQLTPLKPNTKNTYDWQSEIDRWTVLITYLHSFGSSKADQAEVERISKREYDSVKYWGSFTESLLSWMATFCFPHNSKDEGQVVLLRKLLSPKDEKLWSLLAEAKSWDSDVHSILVAMAKQVPADQKPLFWKRASLLSKNAESGNIWLNIAMEEDARDDAYLRRIKEIRENSQHGLRIDVAIDRIIL